MPENGKPDRNPHESICLRLTRSCPSGVTWQGTRLLIERERGARRGDEDAECSCGMEKRCSNRLCWPSAAGGPVTSPPPPAATQPPAPGFMLAIMLRMKRLVVSTKCSSGRLVSGEQGACSALCWRSIQAAAEGQAGGRYAAVDCMLAAPAAQAAQAAGQGKQGQSEQPAADRPPTLDRLPPVQVFPSAATTVSVISS